MRKNKTGKKQKVDYQQEKANAILKKAGIPLPKNSAPSIITDEIDNKSRRVKALKDRCLFLYGTSRPFVLKKSGTSYTLDSAIFKSRAVRAGFTPEQISFIKRVKNYVIKNDIADKFIDVDYQARKINYIQVKEYGEGEIINDIVEIDVNHAYWVTAYAMGVIDKSIFERGEDIDKRVRLACLGTLAKKTETWRFDGKVMAKRQEERSHSTENIWYAICRRVSDVMNECVKIAGDDFVFYWVDGIYIKNNAVTMQKVLQYFAEQGYETKMKPIPEIAFHKNKFVVSGLHVTDKRDFSFGKTIMSNSVTKYNEDLMLSELAKSLFNKKK